MRVFSKNLARLENLFSVLESRFSSTENQFSKPGKRFSRGEKNLKKDFQLTVLGLKISAVAIPRYISRP